MRIAHVVENLEIGGLERMVINLARAQTRVGHQVHIYCVAHAGRLAASPAAQGISVVPLGKRPGFSFRALLQLAGRMRRDRIDLVHTHNAVIHHYGAYAALLAGIKAVINTQHGIGGLSRSDRQRRLFRSALPLTKRVVFVAEQTREFALQTAGVDISRTAVVPNGIDVDAFSCRRTGRVHRDPMRIRFATIGRMVAVKNHANLVKAFASVLQRLPQAELHLMGYGPLEAATEDLVRSVGVSERVFFVGPETDVASFLAGVDLFVLSSDTEGIPVVVLEAMASGLPLVSTRVGGVPSIAPEGEVGWFCPAGDHELLAATMYKAAISPDLRQMGEAAVRRAREKYGIDAICREYETIYQHVLMPSA